MKKRITGLVMILLFSVALLPLTAFAAEDIEVGLSATGQTAEVSVKIPGAGDKDITSMELSLAIKMASQDAGSTQIEFRFADSVKGTVREFRFNRDTQVLTLYIAGTQSLFEEDTLKLGTLFVTGADGNPVKAEISLVEDSLKTVNGAYYEENVPTKAGMSAILGENENPDPSDEDETTGSGEIGMADKTELKEAIDLAASKEEKSFTAASYQALKTALSAAEEVYQDPQATQAQVDEAALNLQNAIGELREAGSSVVGGSDNKEEGSPVTGSYDDKVTPEAQEGGAHVNTGDKNSYEIWIWGLVLSGLGMAAASMLYRKRCLMK